MALRVKRKVFDFFAQNYKARRVDVKLTILREGCDLSKFAPQAQPKNKQNFVQRWYLSLQGEDSPLASTVTSSANDRNEQRVYRYDWAFGLTFTRDFWGEWNWLHDICKERALVVHLLLESTGDAPEAIPVYATLSALRPSRSTNGFFEAVSSKSKTVGEAARVLTKENPKLGLVWSGIELGANLLDSYADDKKTKNWFLYQFLHPDAACPTVEWNINRQVFVEYGPLLRGTLYLAFPASAQLHSGHIRLRLTPQLRFCEEADLDFISPTDQFTDDEQVFLEIKPQEMRGPKAS